jgi:hypothetical protein
MTVLLPSPTPRRDLLRGLIGGGAVSVALPFLDCFLDGSGRAVAATGRPLPVRFGTWYWGMGLTPGHSVTHKSETGPGLEFLSECAALTPYRDRINFYGNFNLPLDGRANFTHYSGWAASRTGIAPSFTGDIPAPTLDLLVADFIAPNTRFKTIDMNAAGKARENFSARSTNSRGGAEISPVQLYARLFGDGFTDPNAATFAPDPRVMARQSVLSAVREQSKKLESTVGGEDRVRLDEYFTSIRQVETQLALQLEKPPPNAACRVPPPLEGPADGYQNVGGLDVETVHRTHRIMAEIAAMAVACDQTRIVNMGYSDSLSSLRKPGQTYHHHLLTHEETIDKDLGYQPLSYYFGVRSMEAFAAFISTFAAIREGDGTLLDHMLIFAGSETNYARLHSIDGLPMFTVGSAGGKLKTGYYVHGSGDPVTRVGLTAMQAMGLPLDSWGERALRTSKTISEVLV